MPITLINNGTGNFLLNNLTSTGIVKLNISQTTTPQSNLVTDSLYMHLDASTYVSGVWQDQTINGNNATINGAIWEPTDGGIFDFNGINNTMTITHNSSLSLNTVTQRTMQMWVKFDALPTSTNRMIVFGKLSSAFVFDGWWGGINSSGNAVIATNGTSTSKTTASTLTISIDNWYLFTFISQITSTANTTKIYVNEIEYVSTFHGTDGYNESNDLTLGYLTPPLTGLGLISYLNGKIGACYFYTKGLTSQEISTNYNATKTRYGL